MTTTTTPTLTPWQTHQLERLKSYYPFRIVWGAISPEGLWESGADKTKRRANDFARRGWTVFIVGTQNA